MVGSDERQQVIIAAPSACTGFISRKQQGGAMPGDSSSRVAHLLGQMVKHITGMLRSGSTCRIVFRWVSRGQSIRHNGGFSVSQCMASWPHMVQLRAIRHCSNVSCLEWLAGSAPLIIWSWSEDARGTYGDGQGGPSHGRRKEGKDPSHA